MAAAAEKKKCALNSTKQWTAKYRSPRERTIEIEKMREGEHQS